MKAIENQRGKIPSKIFKEGKRVIIKNEPYIGKGNPKYKLQGYISEILVYDTYRIKVNSKQIKRYSNQLK
jgi:hypothetical protein